MTFSSGFVHDGATLYCGEAPAMVAVSRILPHLFFTVPASSAILEEKGIQQPTYPTIIIESHARIPQKHPASPIRQNLSSPLVVSLRHFPSRQAPVYPLGGLESTAPSAGRDVSHLWESLYVSVLRRLGGRQSLTSNVVPSGSPSPVVPYRALWCPMVPYMVLRPKTQDQIIPLGLRRAAGQSPGLGHLRPLGCQRLAVSFVADIRGDESNFGGC